MKLYEVAPAYRSWSERVEEADGEVTEALAAEFDHIQSALQEKADAIVALAKEADAEASAFRFEAAAFAAKARDAEHRRESLRRYLLDTMKALGVMRVEGRRFTVTRCTAGTPAIRWVAPEDVPFEFQKVTVELDGKAAQEAYKAGNLPAGFEATFTEFLRVK